MLSADQEKVFTQIKMALIELFELKENEVKLESHLYEDLDLDSIDAVDLVVYLQKETGQKIQPEEFKTVRTVKDVVDAVAELIKE